MPLYTFYPTLANGLASSFETVELDGDADAAVHALRILEEHDSAASVVTYCGVRKLHTRRRMDGALQDALSRVAPSLHAVEG